MGDKVGRVLSLRIEASYIRDSFINELCDLNRDMILSIDIVPVPTDEAIREVEVRSLSVETTIANWQRRQNNNYSAVIPYDFELQRKETNEMWEDLMTRDQRMMFGLVTLVHTVGTLEQLEADTETLQTVAQKNLCTLAPLKYQQQDGFKTALPFGVTRIDNCWRTLTTESVAVLMPFRVQEVCHPRGVYIGQNALSRYAITVDREQLLNTGGFYLGVPGSGKSLGAKSELEWRLLTTNDHVLMCDPEGEYVAIARAMGGTVVKIAAGQRNSRLFAISVPNCSISRRRKRGNSLSHLNCSHQAASIPLHTKPMWI